MCIEFIGPMIDANSNTMVSSQLLVILPFFKTDSKLQKSVCFKKINSSYMLERKFFDSLFICIRYPIQNGGKAYDNLHYINS